MQKSVKTQEASKKSTLETLAGRLANKDAATIKGGHGMWTGYSWDTCNPFDPNPNWKGVPYRYPR